MKKYLLLVFSSFHVFSDPTNLREEEYVFCYEQLLRIKPLNFDICFIDNTSENIESINNEKLKKILNENKYILYNNNIGVINKGLGELDMLKRSSELISFDDYSFIGYLTGRKLITCNYIFDKMLSLEKKALISNPPIIRIYDGKVSPPTPNLYNDMFFAMDPQTIKQYIQFAIPFLNGIINNVGSEQILYEFINQNNISYEWMNSLGFIRNDWNTNSSMYNTDYKNFQFC